VASPTEKPPASEAFKEARENPAYERIIAAATEVFGHFGFTKTSIREIVAAAHVSKPLFYRNFKNKQDVFEVVIDRVFMSWRTALVDEVARTPNDTALALRVLLLTSLEYGRTRPILGRLLMRDSQLLLSTQSDVWDRACRALRELITRVLQRGIEAGEVRSDVNCDHMSDFLTEMHFVYANRQLLTGMAIGAEQAVDLTACMLGGVLLRPEHRCT